MITPDSQFAEKEKINPHPFELGKRIDIQYKVQLKKYPKNLNIPFGASRLTFLMTMKVQMLKIMHFFL